MPARNAQECASQVATTAIRRAAPPPHPRGADGRVLPSALLTDAGLRARFLAALAEHGVVRHAAHEAGVCAATAYRLRLADAGFAAGWAAALAQPATATRAASESWDEARQARFIGALATGASPVQAAQAAGRTLESALRLRGRSERFRQRWDAALVSVLVLVEAAALQRALHGVKRTVMRGGNPDEVIDISDRLVIFLLTRLMPDKYGARSAGAVPAPTLSRAEMIDRIKQFGRDVAATRPAVPPFASAKPAGAVNLPGGSAKIPGHAAKFQAVRSTGGG